jgi:hypothetical protein
LNSTQLSKLADDALAKSATSNDPLNKTMAGIWAEAADAMRRIEHLEKQEELDHIAKKGAPA